MFIDKKIKHKMRKYALKLEQIDSLCKQYNGYDFCLHINIYFSKNFSSFFLTPVSSFLITFNCI